MEPRAALLLLYFAGMGPAPYSQFAIPHIYGKHVYLRPFVLTVRSMKVCQQVQRSTSARGNYAHCHGREDFVYCLRDQRTTPRFLTWCVPDYWRRFSPAWTQRRSTWR